MTTEKPEGAGRAALLDRFYDAEMRYVAAGGARGGASFDDMASCFHPDAVMRQGPSVPFPGDWTGLDGVERFFATLTDTWAAADDLQLRYFDGIGFDGVAVSMRVKLTARATGRSIDAHLAQFIKFEDGLIREFTVFYDDPVQVGEICKR